MKPRIWIAGHTGMAGSAIYRELQQQERLGLVEFVEHFRFDLRKRESVARFLNEERPTHVVMAAAKVGGILANRDNPVPFLLDNLQMQDNVISLSAEYGVKRLVFLASACAYPKHAPVPIQEHHLLQGPLEPTNRPYALAKITGIELCSAYRRQRGLEFFSAMPTNLYGPGDNYRRHESHVLPALLRRFHDAKVAGDGGVVVWGTGQAKREFLYVADLARAIRFLLLGSEVFEHPVNIGTGYTVSITQLAEMIQDVVGFGGSIGYDYSKPDGTPNRQLDISTIARLGWTPQVPLRMGLELAYEDFLEGNNRM